MMSCKACLLFFITAALVSFGTDESFARPHYTKNLLSTEVQLTQNSDLNPLPVRQLDYLLEFDECSRNSETEVTCSFLIQNELSTRRRVSIEDMTLFDASGQAVRQSSREFPGQNHYQMHLPSSVPVKGVAVFDGIPANTGVVFLEVEVYSFTERESFTAGFHLQ